MIVFVLTRGQTPCHTPTRSIISVVFENGYVSTLHISQTYLDSGEQLLQLPISLGL